MKGTSKAAWANWKHGRRWVGAPHLGALSRRYIIVI